MRTSKSVSRLIIASAALCTSVACTPTSQYTPIRDGRPRLMVVDGELAVRFRGMRPTPLHDMSVGPLGSSREATRELESARELIRKAKSLDSIVSGLTNLPVLGALIAIPIEIAAESALGEGLAHFVDGFNRTRDHR